MPAHARILVVAPNWLGDAVMATPALRALHHRFPEARLEVIGTNAVTALLDGLPWIQALHPLPAGSGWRTWRRHTDVLQRPRADLALVFPHSFRAALLARWTHARRRVGQARNGRAWLLTDPVAPHRDNGRIAPTYMVDEYLALAQAIGADPDRNGPELRADAALVHAIQERLNQAAPDRVPHTSQHTQTSHSERSEESLSADATPSFEPSPATRGPRSTADNATQSGPKHLIGNSAPGLASQRGAVAAPATNSADGRPLIGIAPGAAWGPSKRWPAERYAAVADRLHDEYDACCILLTGPGEEETRAAVQKAARHPLLEIDSGKPTIATLKAAVSLLDVLVCNDSGPRHVAIAFNVPTVCIMGPTRPIYSTGPYERGALLRVDVDCGPCQRPTCRTDHRCMTRITPETVAEKASHIWLVEPSD